MIKTLNQRERYVLAGGAVVLGLLLIIFAVVIPYGTALERLDKAIISRQGQLKEVRQLQADYLLLKKQTGQLQRDLGRPEATSPLTFLEETASRIGGRENLVLMRPLPAVTQGQLRIETTEFKLERLGLEQVLRILQAVEQARPPMRVVRLHLKRRFDNAAQLDMNATVSSTRRN
jgi:hypothetical protein